MKFSASAPQVYAGSLCKNMTKQGVFTEQNTKNHADTINFSKNSSDLSFGAAKGTYEWALDWNKEDRKKRIG